MNLTEIKKSLDQLFAKQPRAGARRNIIFWYDEGIRFAEGVKDMTLESAEIIWLDENNMFATKLYIERTKPGGNILVYSKMAQPKIEDNYLADTVKYSQTFSADEVSLILLNYGMGSDLKSTVAKYTKFFSLKKCYKLFDTYSYDTYSENKIHLGVLSALCKLQHPNLDNVVRTLITEMVADVSTLWDDIVKYGNEDAFWSLCREYYGYTLDERSIERLAIMLMCSHLAQVINTTLPKDWLTYGLVQK